jgi:16S rRNA processing protein RimM
LEPGEYFQSDLLGCEVVDNCSGASLGRVTGWEDAGGSGLLILEGGELIPFARSICVDIDPARKRIAVELPQGLKELNTR